MAAIEDGGEARKMQTNQLCTYKEVMQHYYFLKNENCQASNSTLLDTLRDDLINIWLSLRPNIPLMTPSRIGAELSYNLASMQSAEMSKLAQLSDKLYDISRCECVLPGQIPCNNR